MQVFSHNLLDELACSVAPSLLKTDFDSGALTTVAGFPSVFTFTTGSTSVLIFSTVLTLLTSGSRAFKPILSSEVLTMTIFAIFMLLVYPKAPLGSGFLQFFFHSGGPL